MIKSFICFFVLSSAAATGKNISELQIELLQFYEQSFYNLVNYIKIMTACVQPFYSEINIRPDRIDYVKHIRQIKNKTEKLSLLEKIDLYQTTENYIELSHEIFNLNQEFFYCFGDFIYHELLYFDEFRRYDPQKPNSFIERPEFVENIIKNDKYFGTVKAFNRIFFEKSNEIKNLLKKVTNDHQELIEKLLLDTKIIINKEFLERFEKITMDFKLLSEKEFQAWTIEDIINHSEFFFKNTGGDFYLSVLGPLINGEGMKKRKFELEKARIKISVGRKPADIEINDEKRKRSFGVGRDRKIENNLVESKIAEIEINDKKEKRSFGVGSDKVIGNNLVQSKIEGIEINDKKEKRSFGVGSDRNIENNLVESKIAELEINDKKEKRSFGVGGDKVNGNNLVQSKIEGIEINDRIKKRGIGVGDEKCIGNDLVQSEIEGIEINDKKKMRSVGVGDSKNIENNLVENKNVGIQASDEVRKRSFGVGCNLDIENDQKKSRIEKLGINKKAMENQKDKNIEEVNSIEEVEITRSPIRNQDNLEGSKGAENSRKTGTNKPETEKNGGDNIFYKILSSVLGIILLGGLIYNYYHRKRA